MSATLAVTALLMGLAGGPHCAAMCGAACGGLVRLGAAPAHAGGAGAVAIVRARTLPGPLLAFLSLIHI